MPGEWRDQRLRCAEHVGQGLGTKPLGAAFPCNEPRAGCRSERKPHGAGCVSLLHSQLSCGQQAVPAPLCLPPRACPQIGVVAALGSLGAALCWGLLWGAHATRKSEPHAGFMLGCPLPSPCCPLFSCPLCRVLVQICLRRNCYL